MRRPSLKKDEKLAQSSRFTPPATAHLPFEHRVLSPDEAMCMALCKQ